MQRARDIAVQSGLQVADTEIFDPGPEPDIPQALPTDGSASPDMVQAHDQAVAAQQDYQRKVTAFNQAKEEADRANGILDGVKKTTEDYWKDLSEKRYIHAAEFTNGVGGDLITLHESILKKESARLLDEAKVAEARYLSSPGGSAEAKLYEEMRLSKTMGAADLDAEAASIGRRLGSKIPIIGGASRLSVSATTSMRASPLARPSSPAWPAPLARSWSCLWSAARSALRQEQALLRASLSGWAPTGSTTTLFPRA